MKQKDDLESEEDDHSIDIVILENPSKYSKKMSETVKKYGDRIKAHYLCSQNIEMVCFQAYTLINKLDIQQKYDYICISEGDVVLKPGSMRECYNLINPQQPVCSINISLENLKIPPHPADAIYWVPPRKIYKDHKEGEFGLQFVMIETLYFYDFLDALEKKELGERIPLGESTHSFSDTNLRAYMRKTGVKFYNTLKNDLIHIGWDHFLDPKDEYWCHRNTLIKEKKIRVTHDPKNVKFILITNN